MTEMQALNLIGNVFVSIVGAGLTVLILMNWVFPTKEQVNKDCAACRKDLYAKLELKANCIDTRRLEDKMDAMNINITTVGTNVATLTGIIQERHRNTGGHNEINYG